MDQDAGAALVAAPGSNLTPKRRREELDPDALDDRGRPASIAAAWLAGRPASTAKAYRAMLDRLRAYLDADPERLQRPALRELGVADLQGFAASLAGAPAYRARHLSALGSLYGFATRIGYLERNPAAVLQRPRVVADRGARILPEPRVQELLFTTTHPRDRLILRTLYGAAPRVAELCALRWRDVQVGEEAYFVRLLGKGGRERMVRIPHPLWLALIELRAGAEDEAPVFVSNRGGALCESQVYRIVRGAGERIGLRGVSPHWLRHAHASHALDRGCPIHVVQVTLGHTSLATTTIYAHARPSDSSALYLSA